MNSMERVLMALDHKEADRVPVYPIMSGVTRRIINTTYKEWATNPDICADAFLAARKKLDSDCIITLIDLSVECDAWGQKIIYPDSEAAHPDYSQFIIKDSEDYYNVEKADYKSSKRMMMHIETCKKIVENAKGEFPVIAFVFGPLGTLSMLRNQQEMYMDFYDDPDAVFYAATKVNETLKDYVRALMDTGIQGVMIDTLFSSGSIMRKDMWDDLEGALLEDLAHTIRSKNGLVMIHNCGEKPYIDQLIKRMKPDAVSFLFPPYDCVDFKECKEKYGDVTTLIGCVSPSSAVIGSDESWMQECKDCIDDMANGGGFILATGCEYPANAEIERARYMVEIAKSYGKY